MRLGKTLSWAVLRHRDGQREAFLLCEEEAGLTSPWNARDAVTKQVKEPRRRSEVDLSRALDVRASAAIAGAVSGRQGEVVCSFPVATVTNYHDLVALHTTKCTLCSSEGTEISFSFV